MVRKPLNCMRCFFVVLLSTNIVVGKTLILDGNNSRIVVENAVLKGKEG